jgi:hypothetical protein
VDLLIYDPEQSLQQDVRHSVIESVMLFCNMTSRSQMVFIRRQYDSQYIIETITCLPHRFESSVVALGYADVFIFTYHEDIITYRYIYSPKLFSLFIKKGLKNEKIERYKKA